MQRGERPSSALRYDQSDRLNLDASLIDGLGWEAVFAQDLEIQVSRSASLMAPIEIAWRGGRSQQIQWSIDGIALGDALGGVAALRSLDPGLFQGARLYAASSAGLDAPIAGGLALKSPTRGFFSELKIDTLGALGLRVRKATSKQGISFSSQINPGVFRYLDTQGTAFNGQDDTWARRKNNDAARAGLLWHQRLSHGLQLRVLAAHLSGGVSGSADRPLLAVREREALQLMHFDWRLGSKKNRHWVDLSLMNRHHRLADPQAEFSGLAGLQPASEQGRVVLQWRFKNQQTNHGFETRARLFADRINRRPNATTSSATGQRFLARIGASIRRGDRSNFHGLAWISAGQVNDQLQPLIDQLPEALKNAAQTSIKPDWAPGLSLAYASLIRLRLIGGLRRPSVLERVGQHGGLRGNPALRSEQSWSADARWRWPRPSSLIQVDLYARKSTDLIDWSATSFGRAMPVNRARVEIAGAQLKGRLLIARIELKGAYRWQGEWAKDSVQDQRPKRLSGSAEHRLSFVASHRLRSWRWGFGLLAQSQRFLDAANLRALSHTPELQFLVARQFFKGLELRAQLFNASDQKHAHLTLLPGNHTSLVARQDRWGQVLPGRRLELSLRMTEF